MKKYPILFLILLLCASIGHAQYIKLGLNLTRGQTYYLISTTNAAVTQTYQGQPHTTNSIINSRIAFKVIGIRDTLYDMEVKYENLSLKMKFPGGDMTYSSDRADPTDPSSSILFSFKNKPLAAVITKSGNLVSITGISQIFENIINRFPGLDANQKAQIRTMMNQSFGEQAFRSSFDMAVAIFPAVPVRKGAYWTSDTQLITAGQTNVHSIYQLSDITDTFYQIHVSSTITYADKDKFIETNGMPVRNNLNGGMLADLVIDKTTGWVKQSSITQSITGTTEVKDNPKMPGGSVMPVNMKNEIVVTDVH